MKVQDKTPEKQLNSVEIGNLPQKISQNNDSEDDPGCWEKNGGKDWEDERNVYQKPRKTKEQTEMNDTLKGE